MHVKASRWKAIDGLCNAVGGGMLPDPSGIITPHSGSASDTIHDTNLENVSTLSPFQKCDFLNSYFIQMGF